MNKIRPTLDRSVLADDTEELHRPSEKVNHDSFRGSLKTSSSNRPTNPANDGPWMTSNEAASYFRTTPGQIRNYVNQRRLSSYKPFGGRLLFKRADLDRLIEHSRKKERYD